jgi:hypothetical protein
MYKKIQSNSIPAPAAAQLFKLAQALDTSDTHAATEAHEDLKKVHFHAIGSTIMLGLNKLVKAVHKYQI